MTIFSLWCPIFNEVYDMLGEICVGEGEQEACSALFDTEMGLCTLCVPCKNGITLKENSWGLVDDHF